MRKFDRLVIVGASLAGLRTAQALRAEGHVGDLTLIGAEPHLPYNRPPLSKSVLTSDEDVALSPDDDLDADWLVGRTAVSLDTAGQAVTLDNGTRVPYDGLVIATGARPRRLEEQRIPLKGVHLLRTIENAVNLRKALQEGPRRVVVIGGGIIGGEVSSTLRTMGIEVTLINAAPLPMAGQLGDTIGRWLADQHARHGVELISGVRVTALEGDAEVTAVRLSDGRSIPADLVVAGLGVVPNTDWLDDSGVHVEDGVLTDSALFVQGTAYEAANIVAAGDVARWPHRLRRHLRAHRALGQCQRTGSRRSTQPPARPAGGGPVRRSALSRHARARRPRPVGRAAKAGRGRSSGHGLTGGRQVRRRLHPGRQTHRGRRRELPQGIPPATARHRSPATAFRGSRLTPDTGHRRTSAPVRPDSERTGAHGLLITQSKIPWW
jgi:NADPH-dependent 2,4-dienoyl-CoA reductase/sulfur reductase-like enzyme